MKRHLDEELKKLKEKLFRMGLIVEKAIGQATEALFERDVTKAQRVIQSDQEVNLQEIEIDELGHELIALYQPAAVDLRLITMVLKITNDLERMADQAVNIAEAAVIMSQNPPLKPYEYFPKMTESVSTMVRESLKAFMENDPEKARKILESDDTIDDYNHKIMEEVQVLLADRPQHIRTGVSIIMISHNLERIADLATNIAEDVIYLNRGIDVRHHIRERRREKSADHLGHE